MGREEACREGGGGGEGGGGKGGGGEGGGGEGGGGEGGGGEGGGGEVGTGAASPSRGVVRGRRGVGRQEGWREGGPHTAVRLGR